MELHRDSLGSIKKRGALHAHVQDRRSRQGRRSRESFGDGNEFIVPPREGWESAVVFSRPAVIWRQIQRSGIERGAEAAIRARTYYGLT